MEEKQDNGSGEKTVGSVIKAIEIMELLASTKDEIGATEISTKLNYGVSATYHILNTLKICRIIEQDTRTKKYRLGLKLCKIGKMAREQNHLSVLMQPYLNELRDLTDETANLTTLENSEIIYIAQAESERLIRMFTKIGARAPLYCSAAGKVLLAYQSDDKQDSILKAINFKEFTNKTITDPLALKQSLLGIKAKGYAFDDEEREYGVSCIAAPIFDFDGEVIAAISISGPTERINTQNKDRLIDYVVQVTRGVSEQFGYHE